ncbi:iron complex outermembrane recepter protein [Pseudoalteromonas rubra]|uniref:Iron complex outermembrane recepter protein n=1 Tax=Pseudoalteromonas rubra TaxID=43658 RepID=A0A8T0C6J5_9GAMM|nr:TonB-dependent receptor [Pseudoalteromonas rubra]KAF7786008.1 iron complex outermembrane recepter protein [Pseudoalteromonas rubra]
MFKQSLITFAITSAIFSSQASAAQLKGKVLDTNNQPVPNATVHLHGKSQSVKTDINGQFSINVDQAAQLHVSKDHFINERIDVTPDSPYVTVKLAPSSVESVVVYAAALHKSNIEMASPVAVLSGDELKNSAKPTLGETLKQLPGINASYFGPVSSSPIIRGLDGPRVKITQNGLDSSDASRVGPDHANTNDSLAAQQIEVLRGPATLLYGSGAIGGVVNVVDNRIPTDVIEGVQGAAEFSHDTNSNTNTVAALFEAGNNGFNFHFDGVTRKGGDYDTPRFALPGEEHDDHDHDDHEEHGHDEHGEDEHGEEAHGETEYAERVANTFIDSEQFNIGTSFVGDHLTVGLSYGRIETDYGIPAHSHEHHDHGDEHDHDEHDHDEHDHDEHGHDEHDHDDHDEHSEDEHDHAHGAEEEAVFARVKQDRWQALFNYALHNNWIESIQVRAGFTDYEHSEIEHGAVGTTFTNETTEIRTNIEHRLGEWHGIIGYHFSDSDYAAEGAEAFTPATNTKTHALYVLEERRFGDVTLELGARVEDFALSSNFTSGHDDHDEHDHDDHGHDEHDHEHEGHEDEHMAEVIDYTLDTTNFSASIGAVYDYAEGQNVAINLSRSERAPLTAELLSNGLHIATSTYELGLGYHIEGDEVHFEPEHIEQERSTNLDISFRRFIGDFGYTVNFFYNDVSNYYYQRNTGYMYTGEHGIELADHHHDGALPVYQFESADAELYGFEFDAHYQIDARNRIKVFGDHLRAELDSGEYLPRIPSNKLGTSYRFELQDFMAELSATHYMTQDNLAQSETKTDSYTLLDASFSYNFSLSGVDLVGYVNVDNITDELGFVHSSFIKEQAPLPGRNFKLGIRGYF